MAALFASASATSDTSQREFTVAQVIHYPYAMELVSADHADVIAWVRNFEGIRNIWMAHGPAYTPVQVTHYADDDGQELTQLMFTPDAMHIVYVRGGDHDANWPAEGNLAPDPTGSPVQPHTEIWSAPIGGGQPVKVAEGDAPAISSRGQLVYTKDDHVWTAALDGTGTPERLFFDRGKDSELKWSPDGTRLAFVSDRTDHSFIGVFGSKDQPLRYLAPSTDRDSSPRWSADGRLIAFVRRPGDGGPPQPIMTRSVRPWSIWVADAGQGTAHALWKSPETLSGSFPDVDQGANLQWAGDRIVFLAYLDDWPHLYSLPGTGGTPLLLTPGAYMVEHISEIRDGRTIIYDANTGTTPGDGDRRHVFRVSAEGGASSQLTSGESLEWQPVSLPGGRAAFVAATAQRPPAIGVAPASGPGHRLSIEAGLPADFPLTQLEAPKSVTFTAADGLTVHGQLFESAGKSGTPKPGIIFVHGGPPRQMLLGWHYMEYYSNAYAVNQYLAAHGFVVLSVNYRLGIGYGRTYHEPEHWGPLGASEYQDVVAGARFLQTVHGVDPARIGIWGGSYGGYLTAMALASDAAIFKAGVDLHGVHDWSPLLSGWFGKADGRYEKGDREAAIRSAWESSPDSRLDGWRAPVLLIQGDDDRNVPFEQTVDLARRLQARQLPFEELVIPNEIHGFLRHASWLQADMATAEFLTRILKAQVR